MMIEYVGERSRYYNGQRHAECYGNEFITKEQQDEEQRKMDYIVKRLKEFGWTVDDGIAHWFYVPVEDRDEYNSLVKDYKKAKKELQNEKSN